MNQEGTEHLGTVSAESPLTKGLRRIRERHANTLRALVADHHDRCSTRHAILSPHEVAAINAAIRALEEKDRCEKR